MSTDPPTISEEMHNLFLARGIFDEEEQFRHLAGTFMMYLNEHVPKYRHLEVLYYFNSRVLNMLGLMEHNRIHQETETKINKQIDNLRPHGPAS